MLAWLAARKANIVALETLLAAAGPLEAKVSALVVGFLGVLVRAIVAGVVAFLKSIWSSVFPSESKGN